MDISALAAIAPGPAQGDVDPSLRGARTPAAQRQAAAGQFEAILLRQLLSDSVSSMMGGDDTTQGSIYGYMLTDVLANKLSQGAGMGLSKMIEQQLTPRGTPVDPPSTPAPAPAPKETS